MTRSLHPNYSFAAWGRESEYVTSGEKLDFSMDRESPLGRVYELDGYVLLLGVGHGSNTSLHLAEYLAEYDGKPYVDCFAPMNRDGIREWIRYRDIDLDSDDFERRRSGVREDRRGRDRRRRQGDRETHEATGPR